MGYWKLDDGSGTSASDSSGNGSTGALSGSPLPTWTTGKTGNAISFAGSGGYVNFGTPATLNNLMSQGGGGMSVAAWVYPAAASASNQVILDKGEWQFSIYSNGALTFGHRCGTGIVAAYSAANAVPVNQWDHVVATWDGSTSGSKVHFYVNGVAIGAVPQDCSGAMTSDTIDPLTLGASQWNGWPFPGKIDEVRVYNRVLSSSEVGTISMSTRLSMVNK